MKVKPGHIPIMDFSKFAEDNFDCKEWVNAALRAKKDSQTPLDVSELCVL